MESKKRYGFAKIFVFILTVFSMINLNNITYAHYINSAQEKMIGSNSTSQFEMKHKINTDENISALEQKLIKNNPNELTSNISNKRYLENIKIISDDNSKNAFTFPGGFIYFTQGTLNKSAYKTNLDGTINTNYHYNYDCNDVEGIYKASNLAGVMAHEMAHWYNEDYLRSVDRTENINMIFAVLLGGGSQTISGQLLSQLSEQVIHNISENSMSLKVEKEADSTGLRFIDNTNELSTGGMAYVFYDYMLDDIKNGYHDPTHGSSAHSNNDVRLKRIIDFWSNKSKGLITFNKTTIVNKSFKYKMALNNKSISNDDKYFGYGLLPDGKDVSAQERTFYFAGQLAKAIDKGYLDLNSKNNNKLYIVSDEYLSKYYNMKFRKDGLVLVAFNTDKNDMIILNRFDYLKYSQIKTIKSQFNSLDKNTQEEYNAFKYITQNTGIRIGFLTSTDDAPN